MALHLYAPPPQVCLQGMARGSCTFYLYSVTFCFIKIWIHIAQWVKQLVLRWTARHQFYLGHHFISTTLLQMILELSGLLSSRYLEHLSLEWNGNGVDLHLSCCTPLPAVPLLALLLTGPLSRVVIEKLLAPQLLIFPAFHGNWRFITTFSRACHLSACWAGSIQSIPYQPISFI